MGSVAQVTVAIATRNRSALLVELLASLRAQTIGCRGFEVVVVNDGSSDDTAAVLRTEVTRGGLALRVIDGEGRGPAAARNLAWRAAGAPLVAFTDDDCVVSPEWLAEGLAAAAAAPDSIVQGRTEPRPDQLDRLSPFSRTQQIRSAGPLYETCNIFYPVALLEGLGGFAEDVFAMPAGEDTDLAWRALETGARAVYAPAALVHHAVLVEGPIGALRHAARWHSGIAVYARHPGLRRHLRRRLFWSENHEHLLRFLLALAVRRRSRTGALLLAWPYLLRLGRRRTGPLLAPYIVLLDTVELFAVLVGAWRNRVLVI